MIEFQDKPTPEGYIYDLAVVKGALDDTDIDNFINSKSPRTLVLNVFNGWDGDLASVVSAINGVNVVSIDIFCASNSNINANAFDGLSAETLSSIRYLRLAGQVVGSLSLDIFPNLIDFGMGFTSKGRNKLKIDWGRCSNLVSLGGAWSNFPDMNVLSGMPKLSHLRSVRPGCTPESLSTIDGLNWIDFSYWAKLKNFSQLHFFQKKLTRLELYSASKIESYDGLDDFLELRFLSLMKCPPIKYGSVFSSMKQLEMLNLAETVIVDGYISCFYSLPNLKNISLVDQTNLSPSREVVYRHFGLK